MGSFRIKGGNKLSGDITPQGAKNEALQVISAVLLTPEEVRINNIPQILDVIRLINLLKGLGVKVKKVADNDYVFKADTVDLDYLNTKEYYKNATSIRG